MISVKLFRPDGSHWWYPATSRQDADERASTLIARGEVTRAELYSDASGRLIATIPEPN